MKWAIASYFDSKYMFVIPEEKVETNLNARREKSKCWGWTKNYSYILYWMTTREWRQDVQVSMREQSENETRCGSSRVLSNVWKYEQGAKVRKNLKYYNKSSNIPTAWQICCETWLDSLLDALSLINSNSADDHHVRLILLVLSRRIVYSIYYRTTLVLP